MMMTVMLAAMLAGGCALFGKRDRTTLRWHEQVSGSLPDSRAMNVTVPKADLRVTVSPYPTLSEKDVLSAEIQETAGGAAIMVRFDAHGTFVLDEMTTRTRGRYVVVFLKGRPVAVWMVDRRLTNGQYLLEGDFTEAEARAAADDLNRLAKKRR
jgi:preprotein translocase subunit SecD